MRLGFFVIVAAILVYLAIPSSELNKCGSGQRVNCVVDGDTIWLRGEKIRLMGFDTPETTTNICGGVKETRLGAEATNRLIELLNESSFTVHRDGEDRYGRTLAVIRVGDANVGDILVAEGLARYWPDGREFWCE